MPAATNADIRRRAADLQRWISEGRIAEALDEFYAPDVAMQENTEPPCVGLPANKRREAEFVASVRAWKRFDVRAIAVEGDTSFVETVMDYVLDDGTAVHTEQVSRAKWRDGRIVHERFYHA